MELNYLTEKRICPNCGQEFETVKTTVFGREFILKKFCQPCSDRLIEAEREKEEAKKQGEISSQRRLWRENCGISPRYMSEDFSTFKTDRPGNVAEVYRKCLDYADGFPVDYNAWLKRTNQAYPSLLLYSPGATGNGNGKTHLVMSIAHRILDRWQGENIARPVQVINEPDIYDRIQQTYSYSMQEREQKQSEQDIIAQYSRVRLLIIDDLGKVQRRDMEFVRRTLYAIINRRYDALLPVVITTNKDAKGLVDYLGNDAEQATFDRIIGMTQGKFIQVKGQSYRRPLK